jgi:hypothetical protein
MVFLNVSCKISGIENTILFSEVLISDLKDSFTIGIMNVVSFADLLEQQRSSTRPAEN